MNTGTPLTLCLWIEWLGPRVELFSLLDTAGMPLAQVISPYSASHSATSALRSHCVLNGLPWMRGNTV